MTRIARPAALTAIVIGVVLATAGAAALVASGWVGVQFLRSSTLHDTYFMAPGVSMLVVFGIGVASDIVFRSQATRFGRRAVLVWRTHLAFTTVLIVAAGVATARAQMTWPSLILFTAVIPLMLIAHGVGLVAGGMVVLRAGKQA